MKFTSLALSFGMVAVLGACGGDGEGGDKPLPMVDCSSGEAVPTYSQLQPVFVKCTVCHSSTKTDATSRQQAPAGVDFDTYAAAAAHAEDAAAEVFAGTMPPAALQASLGLDETQKASLYRWALCGAPQ